MISKKIYFRSIVFMILASTYLPIVFNNLPPYIGSHHLWTIIWGISIIVLYPKLLLNKAIALVLSYALFIYLATKTIWKDMDAQNNYALYYELYCISIGITVFTFFNQTRDYIGLAIVTKWSIIFLLITSIMTIISSLIDPMYARNIVGIGAITKESEREIILGYKKFGGGVYSTAIAFMSIIPIHIYYYKNINKSLISKKYIILSILLISIALFSMQIFGNILIAIIFCSIAIFGMRKIKNTLLAMALFTLILLSIPKVIYVESLLSISNYFKPTSELNFKFRDLANFIKTGANIENSNTGVGERVQRYPELMEVFFKSPIFGYYYGNKFTYENYNRAGGHLYWMNKLAITGIIGFIFFITIPIYFINNSLKLFEASYKFYYILGSLSIICYGLIKAIAGRDAWYSFFIIIPGLYYLPILRNRPTKINKAN